MREVGIVSSVSGATAEVSIRQGAACANCRICLFRPDGTMCLTVSNDAGAKIGDTVEVEMPEHRVIISGFLLFIMPLVAFFGGFMIRGIDFAFLCLVIYSILVYFIDKRFSSHARISRLLS